jgi:hypothetical protein
MGERFKLSQICTISHRQRNPSVDQFFGQHKKDLENVMETCKGDPLGVHVCKLLTSISNAASARRGAAADSHEPRRIVPVASLPNLPRFEPLAKS